MDQGVSKLWGDIGVQFFLVLVERSRWAAAFVGLFLVGFEIDPPLRFCAGCLLGRKSSLPPSQG